MPELMENDMTDEMAVHIEGLMKLYTSIPDLDPNVGSCFSNAILDLHIAYACITGERPWDPNPDKW